MYMFIMYIEARILAFEFWKFPGLKSHSFKAKNATIYLVLFYFSLSLLVYFGLVLMFIFIYLFLKKKKLNWSKQMGSNDN